MKLFIGFSNASTPEEVHILKQLLVFLEGRGHEILNKKLLMQLWDKSEEPVAPTRAFELSMHWLKYAEFIVAEASHDSYNLGFEIAHATAHHVRKAVVFYKSGTVLPSHLEGCTLAHVYVRAYTDFESMRQMLTLLKL